jgi:hemolysin activation/secretion protein
MALAILMAPAIVYAQVTPDAGRILEANKPPPLIAPPATAGKVLPDVAPPMLAKDTGSARVMVRGFTFEGASVFSAGTLQALLASYAGRELTFAQLTQAAAKVSAHYRAHGYFLASAYLPAQDLSQGTVKLQVLEGRVSALRVFPDAGVRLKPAMQRRYLDALVKIGQPVGEDQLERALLLTQDLPGVSARAELSPGAALGETAVDVGLSERPLISSNLGLDNSSNRYTGRMRATGAVNLNDLFGSGAQASLQVASTGSHFNYVRAGVVAPVGDDGTRIGASYSRLRYQLGADFAALNARGKANVAQVLLAHPLIRSRDLSVQLRAGFEDKRYQNSANGIETGDKYVRVVPIAYDLNVRDEAFGGGTSNMSVEMVSGRVDLSGNAGAAAADLAGPRSEGHFARTNYQLGRYQRIGSSAALLLKLSGQVASKNLEAGEKLSLGGPDKVRAYPSGEASGDEGQVLALEARYGVASIKSELSVFFDYGHIKLNRQVYPGALLAGGPGNSYTLKGVGAGVQWNAPFGTTVQLQVATKVGRNPARSLEGKDVDGSASRTRAWLQVTAYF